MTQRPIPNPHSEAIERIGLGEYRILWDGFEVATTSYCEDPKVARQFALVPDLIKALDAFRDAFDHVRMMDGWDESQADLWAGPALSRADDIATAVLNRARER